MQVYKVTYLGIPVRYGTLSECLRAIADRLGVREGAARVTVKEAMDKGYRIATA